MESKKYEKNYKKLFSDTLLFAASNFGSKILTLLLVPLYTSVLTTEEYGLADIFMTTVNLLSEVLPLSICEATLRFALDKKNNRPEKVLGNSILMILLSTIITCIPAIYLKVADNKLSEYWWMLIISYMAVTMGTCLAHYAKGKERSKVFAIQGLIYTIMLVTSNIVFLTVFKIGIYGYLVSVIVANISSSLFITIALGIWKEIIIPRFDIKLMKRMLTYSIPLVPGAIAWWVNTSADKYMLVAIIGEGANGLYAVAHKVPSVLTAVIGVFLHAWRVSAISTFEEHGYKSEDYYSEVYGTYLIVCIYVCMMLTLFSQLIAKFLFRSDYYVAWELVPPLLLASVFEAFSAFLTSIYAAVKKTGTLFISTAVGMLFNIVLNYLLIQKTGIMGAAIATFISFFIVWIIRVIVLRNAIKIKINYIKSALSISIVMICGIYFSVDLPAKYLVYVLGFLIVLSINFVMTKKILSNICQTIYNYIKKGD